MLRLAAPTDPHWLERARENLDDVLVDHAHCEKKAAGAAVKLLFSYPHHAFMQHPVAALAQEELQHFGQVLRLLERRGIRYRSMPPSPYAAKLHRHVRSKEPQRAIDLLLVMALIEGRSCERFQILSEGLDDDELATFFAGLLASEARHHGLYYDLALQLGSEDEVKGRMAELAEQEAAILRDPSRFVRLHT